VQIITVACIQIVEVDGYFTSIVRNPELVVIQSIDISLAKDGYGKETRSEGRVVERRYREGQRGAHEEDHQTEGLALSVVQGRVLDI